GATDIAFSDVYDLVASYNGIMIPAHLDRSSNSLLSNLGFVPEDSKFTCFELHDISTLHKIRKANPYLEQCRVITDSDAHYLVDINEAKNSLIVEENTPEAVLRALITPDTAE
ncbi:MAG: phosphoesterase, partial [Firmicutes bacterium]|nr:phosphoesterase [Bacillota bacterium]